jgi:hypothetical protein
MVKRAQTKKKRRKKSTEKTTKKRNKDVEKVLIENFVALQKVMTNLSSKFDNLSDQISKLLNLFEISAKTLAEKEFKIEKGENNKIIAEKLDNLIDQNKTIARGLTLLHENSEEEIPLPPRPLPLNKNPPQLRRFPAEKKRIETPDNYQKSISSNENYEE